MTMKTLLERIVTALVDHPEEVHIQETPGEGVIIYEIRCNQRDIRHLVGKRGQNILGIRLVMQAAAGRFKKRVHVEIIEAEGPRPPRTVPEETWNR